MSEPTYNPQLLGAVRESGWRIDELATLCRLSEVVFFRCLTGQTDIDDSLRERLSIVLGRPVSELFPSDQSGE